MTAPLTGTIVDINGAVIPEATVTVRNLTNGFTRQIFLFTYAKDHSVDFERPADEAHEVLIVMNSSLHAPCSEE